MYGFTEFRFLDSVDLWALGTTYDQNMSYTPITSTSLANTTQFSKYHVSTHCISRLANTSGATIYVDFYKIKNKRIMRQASQWPSALTDPLQGSPIVLSESLTLHGAPSGPGAYARVVDVDSVFTAAPDWHRFYKVFGHAAFKLEHGQAIEIKWRMPTVSFSKLELAELVGQPDPTSVPAVYIPGRTMFTLWRIRGTVGVTAQTGSSSATTAIATAALTTTRTYTVRHSPVLPSQRTRFFASDFSQSATQVWTNNQYGTGTVLQSETTA